LNTLSVMDIYITNKFTTSSQKIVVKNTCINK
jgi:hypothetical protein